MELSAGTVVDSRYIVRHLLGSGGMAHVYAAEDSRLGVDVALKVLSLPTVDIRGRLLQEGRVQAALKHPNVLTVTDIIDIDGSPGLVMELVHGPSLDTLITACPLSLAEAEHLGRGIIDGVKAAHALGLVHRDLKPANVLISRIGDKLVPKVADFGLVKLLDGAPSGTRTGIAMGTPRYMAPEQVRDSKSVDARADVFSVGAILYELFSGKFAFDGADTYEIFNALVEGRFTPLTDLLDVPDRVAEAVAGALQADREQRLPSMDALLDVLNSGSGAPPAHWRPQLLDKVMELAPEVPESMEPPGEATWVGLESIPEGSSAPPEDKAPTAPTLIAPEEPTPARSPRRRLPWLLLGGVALILVFGTVATTFSRPEPRIFTATEAPEIGDPTTQKLFARAWEEYLANEDGAALLHIQQTLDAGSTDPAVFLLGAAVELGFFDFDGFAEFAERGAEASVNQTGPIPSLLQDLDSRYTTAGDLSWWKPTLTAHLERYPNDSMAQFLYVMGMLAIPEHVPLDIEAMDRLIANHPSSIGAWGMKIDGLRRVGRTSEALILADEALVRHPRSAAMHAIKATCAIELGDSTTAIAEGNAALRIDPSYWPGRLMAAIGALNLGDESEFQRLVTPMLGDETPAEQSLRFGIHIAKILGKRGRLEAAAVWWQRHEETTQLTDDRRFLLLGLSDQVVEVSHSWIATDAELERRLQRLDSAAADPSVVASGRRGPGLTSVFGHGLLAARSADRVAAQRAIDSLATAEPSYAARIDAELAAAMGDIQSLTQTDGDCWTLCFRGTGLVDLGHFDAADKILTELEAGCPSNNIAPQAMAAAAAIHIARAREDKDAEAAATEKFSTLWRQPDPDLPVMKALQEP